MPLSPADFYAYSQATGAPVADTPEERARQARDVYEFRQQQLQAPREESNIFDTLAKTALAAGTAAGGYGLYRALRNPEARQATRNAISNFVRPNANSVDVQNVRRAANYNASKVYERPPAAVSSATVDLNAVKPDVAVQRNTPIDIWESNETYPEVKNVLKTTVKLPSASQRLLNPDFASQFLESNEQDYLRQKNLEQGRLTQQVYKEENARQARDVANENTAFHNDLDNLILDIRTEPDAPAAKSVVNPHQFAQETLVQMQNAQGATIDDHSVNALNSAEDQLTGRAVHQQQINPHNDLSQTEFNPTQQHYELTGQSTELPTRAIQPSSFNEFSSRANFTTGLAHAWDLEEKLDRAGQLNQKYQQALSARNKPSAFDLTGRLGDLGTKLPRGSSVTTEELPYGPRTAQIALQDFVTTKNPINKNTIVHTQGEHLDPLEIADRVSAAANYPEGHPMRAALLNPNVSTESVAHVLPDRLLVRGGRVGKNLTFEPEPGARASMTEVPYDDYELSPGYGNSEDNSAEYDVTTGNQGETRYAEDNASDYGDIEGPGGFVETHAFKERTDSGSTMIPGQTSETRGKNKESFRQEREIDRQMPIRSTAEGDTDRGYALDPLTKKLVAQQTSRRVGTPLRGTLETTDPNVEGSKLVGNYEPALTREPSPLITTQPQSRWKEENHLEVGDERIVLGSDGRHYVETGKQLTAFTGEPLEGPLMGIRGVKMKGVKQVGNKTVETESFVFPQASQSTATNSRAANANLQGVLVPVALNRQLAESLAQDAQQDYFNYPQAKHEFLQEHNPSQYNKDVLAGVPLAEMGDAASHNSFIIHTLDKNLRQTAGIALPILSRQVNKNTGDPYYSAEAHQFVNNLLKTTKETPRYGVPVVVDADGKVLYQPKKNNPKYMEPIIQPGYEGSSAVPIPGQYKISGSGGVDPMTLPDEEGGLGNYDTRGAFYSPRVESRGQERPTDEMLAAAKRSREIRNVISTDPVGYSVRSPGSFARTQNPYTGAAAAAMGLADRVNSGNYQYTPQQLRVVLQPTSNRQLDQRNQFALTANLTPGGKVRQGAMNLGTGLGTIATALESLPNESATIKKYGASGSALKEFGNTLMAQAARRKPLSKYIL